MFQVRERDFRQLLNSSSRLNLSSTFEEARALFGGDARYAALGSDDVRERVFEDFMRDTRKEARDDLILLFRSVQKINANTPTSGPDYELVLSMLRVRTRFFFSFFFVF